MSEPEDTPRRENDYLGDQPLPTSLAEIKKELEHFLNATEFQVGSMNLFSTEGFLNEQPFVYRSVLIRWIVKALRQRRGTQFLKDLTRALANINHPALMSPTARQLMQSTSALSQRGDPVVDSILEKLRNPQWLARTSLNHALEAKLLRRLGMKPKAFEKPFEAEIQCRDGRKEKGTIKVQQVIHSTDTGQKNQDPTQSEVIKHWEKRTGKSRYEINVPREMRAAKLELPKGKSGRPRRSTLGTAENR